MLNIKQTHTVISRDNHVISRANISPSALKVLYRLHSAGYAAYLVGGSVRDLLLGEIPKDFDIATNAHPEEIHKLFRNCLIIGRRFRLAHIRFGHEIIEVATFRADHSKANGDEARSVGKLIVRDNVYGSLEEDAWRRDFTVNALYYNIADFSLVDYCGGLDDLTQKTLKIIGDPIQRYHEDPVRLLRVIRFAAKLRFSISPETARPIKEMSVLLTQVSPARLFEETLKLLLKGHAESSFNLMCQYEVFKQLFPETSVCLVQDNTEWPVHNLILTGMRNTDLRVAEHRTVTPAFIFAVLLWYPLLKEIKQQTLEAKPDHMIHENAIRKVLKNQQHITTIPKRFTQSIIEIWRLQFRLEKRLRRSIVKIFIHPRFRAGYDFLLLRAEAGEKVEAVAKWWGEFQTADEKTRAQMQQALERPARKPSRRRRKPKRTLIDVKN